MIYTFFFSSQKDFFDLFLVDILSEALGSGTYSGWWHPPAFPFQSIPNSVADGDVCFVTGANLHDVLQQNGSLFGAEGVWDVCAAAELAISTR